MSKLLVTFFSLFLIVSLNAQDVFQRSSTIHTLQYEPGGGGFGDIIAGVDFDGDGKPEIYACNSNFIDREGELVPRLYKFEWNESTATWDSVWGATAPYSLQNTWPAITWGDLDKDGKPEIYWAPVNYSPYPDQARILVYESVGDGSDNMGVDDGFGAFGPNATTDIVPGDGINLRPIKMVVKDVDNDGTDELVFVERGAYCEYGVLSVSSIPDDGDGSETWTLEASGLNDTNLADVTMYDMAIVNSTIYLFASSGAVYPVKYENNTWTSSPPLQNVGDGYGSFKGSVTADLDNDGTDEIILGGWDSPTRVFILKQVADTLQSFNVMDTTIDIGILNGAAVGDLDNDGNPDFVFGSRAAVPNNAMLRVEFQGGDITDPANYTASLIDSLLVPAPGGTGGQLDVVAMGNIDGDPADEVVYTQGYTRGVANDTTADAAIVDLHHTPTSVKLASNKIPEQFYLNQNYPNPFNPSTTIKFGLTKETEVNLKVYNILGQEVISLINGKIMKAGTYEVNFTASKLASGTYIYRLRADNQVLSKKMVLLK